MLGVAARIVGLGKKEEVRVVLVVVWQVFWFFASCRRKMKERGLVDVISSLVLWVRDYSARNNGEKGRYELVFDGKKIEMGF